MLGVFLLSGVMAKPVSKQGAARTAKPAAQKPKPKPAIKVLQPYSELIPDTTVKFDMVAVPAGEVRVADPAKPDSSQTVKLQPFWIGKTEVTWDEYDAFAFLDKSGKVEASQKDATSHPSKPYGAPDRGFGHHAYPVMSITYYAAQKYCDWLSAKTGKKYRLPTEAEWEYACRANSPEPAKDKLADYAWFWQEKTQAVGKKLPNAWGIYDMLGNVGEWCTGMDGRPVLRGGAYDDVAKDVNPAARKTQAPSWNITDPQNPKSKWWLSDGPFAGFRVLREP